MKKILLVFMLLLMGFSSLFAGVTVKDFFGKVKVKYDGDIKWSRIEIGQELPANTLVSTGFNSQIVLDLGNAILDVLPLTRMTIDEITETQDTIKTALVLKGGRVKADVGKIEGKVNDFKIKSPVATASVRGTKFAFSGKTLDVIRGKVSFYPTKNKKPKKAAESKEEEEESESDTGAGVDVSAGGKTQMTSADAAPASPSSMAKSASSVSASTKPSVVKTTATISLTGTTTDDVPTADDVSTAVEGTANVTVTLTISE